MFRALLTAESTIGIPVSDVATYATPAEAADRWYVAIWVLLGVTVLAVLVGAARNSLPFLGLAGLGVVAMLICLVGSEATEGSRRDNFDQAKKAAVVKTTKANQDMLRTSFPHSTFTKGDAACVDDAARSGSCTSEELVGNEVRALEFKVVSGRLLIRTEPKWTKNPDGYLRAEDALNLS
jgi:hypothetical protein